MLTTTCPNPHCGEREFCLLHELPSETLIYCQRCGYEARHVRRNPRPMGPVDRPVPKPKPKGKPRNLVR